MKKYYANVEEFNRRLDEFENYYEENEFDTLEKAKAKFEEIDINDYQAGLCENDQKRVVLNKIIFDSDGNIYDNEMAY